MGKKKTRPIIEETRLILLNGATVDISYPEDIVEDVWEEIEQAFAGQSLWWCGNWLKLRAEYMGHGLDFIDFKKVVGIA